MLLSELKKQVDALMRKSKAQGVDPEVRLAILPKFPTGCTVHPKLVSNVNGDFTRESVGEKDFVFLGELKETGYLEGDVSHALDWT